MKYRIFLLGAVAFLAAATLIFPGSRKIEQTMEATEYSFADPDYAVTHVITVNGYDTRNFIGRGRYEGIFAAEGWETAQEGWKLTAKFPVPDTYGNAAAADPSGQLLSSEILSFLPNRNWTSFVALIQTVEDSGDHRIGSFDADTAHFIVSGTRTRAEALAEACRLTRGTSLELLFRNR